MENDYREVYFDEFCKKCKHAKTVETEDPCNGCLAEPYNLHTHQPVNYEENGK